MGGGERRVVHMTVTVHNKKLLAAIRILSLLLDCYSKILNGQCHDGT